AGRASAPGWVSQSLRAGAPVERVLDGRDQTHHADADRSAQQSGLERRTSGQRTAERDVHSGEELGDLYHAVAVAITQAGGGGRRSRRDRSNAPHERNGGYPRSDSAHPDCHDGELLLCAFRQTCMKEAFEAMETAALGASRGLLKTCYRAQTRSGWISTTRI